MKKNVEFLLVYVKNRDSESALDPNQAFDETELMEHINSMREEKKSWKYTRAILEFGDRVPVTTTLDKQDHFMTDGFHFMPDEFHFMPEPISSVPFPYLCRLINHI